MHFLHRPRRLLITGISGSGKSTYFIDYINAVEPQYDHVCIFDHECEFMQRTGARRYSTPEDLQNPERGLLCYDYSDMYQGDLQTGFEFFADYVFQLARSMDRKCLFSCDEFQKIVSTDDLSPDVTTIIETGRRYRIDTCFVSQQVNLLHNRLRNQVKEVVTFRQNDPRAMQWLLQFGFTEEAVRSLQSGEFISRTDSGAEATGQIFGGKQFNRAAPEQAEKVNSEEETDVDDEAASP